MGPIDQLVERRLVSNDVDNALLLSREAGWNQTVQDWRLMLGFGLGFGFETVDKRLVATALTVPHGNSVVWVSMVLVTKEFRQRGLATRLLSSCIESTTGKSSSLVLDATETGRLVYEQVGFQPLHGLHRMHRRAATRSAPIPIKRIPVSCTAKSDLPEIIKVDKTAFGADRSVVLRHLHEWQPSMAFSVRTPNKDLRGYVFGREGSHAFQLGPLVAEDDDTAVALIARALDGVAGPVYIDALDGQGLFRYWLEQNGFQPQRSFTRMILGSIIIPDQPNRVFAAAGPELG